MQSGKLQLVKAVIETLGVSQAFEFVFDSDAPPGTGLGSSSTLVVAMLGSLARWRGIGMTEYELAELAYHIERERVGFKGGRQDQYAATFGGFNFIEFHRDGVVVNPLRIKDEVLNELQYRLLLCDTGRSRISGSIIDDQIRRYVTGNKETARALDKTKELAYEMKKALLLGRIGELGELLNLGWQYKKSFTEGITNAFIDELYEVACREGAIGGKLLGAGGGGHLLLLCEHDRRHRVVQRLEAAGGKIVKFAFDFSGLQTWETEAT
jgi:D-glycero-alpha-D-manno-heptose-7-phosphate kinase